MPPAPASADWTGLTTATVPLASGADQGPAYLGRQPAMLEVLYREPFTRYTSLIAGHYPGTGNGSTIEVALSRRRRPGSGYTREAGSCSPATPAW